MSIRNLTRAFIHLGKQKEFPFGAVRFYGRWMHRNPAKVLLPFESTTKVSLKKENVIDLNPADLKKTQDKRTTGSSKVGENHDDMKSAFPTEKVKEIKKNREEKLKKRKFYLSQQKVFDDDNEIIYEKLKENDGRITQLLTNLKSKKERLRLQQVMVEGWRLIVDGLEAKCKLKYVIFSRAEDLNNLRPFLPKTGAKLFKIPYREIELWSDVETSPGVFGQYNLKYVIFSRAEDLNNLRPFLPKTGAKLFKIPYREIELWSDVETSPGVFGQYNLKYVIFSRAEDLNNLRPFLPKTGAKLFKIPYREIELWSDVETSPGV